jgi:hypothetical protein
VGYVLSPLRGCSFYSGKDKVLRLQLRV